jgi:hypothetical protein
MIILDLLLKMSSFNKHFLPFQLEDRIEKEFFPSILLAFQQFCLKFICPIQNIITIYFNHGLNA